MKDIENWITEKIEKWINSIYSLNNPIGYINSRNAEKSFRALLHNSYNHEYFAICQSTEWQDKYEHWDICATNKKNGKTEFFDIKIVEEKYRGNGHYSISNTVFDYLLSIQIDIRNQYSFIFPEYNKNKKESGKWIRIHSIDLIACIETYKNKVIYSETLKYKVLDLNALKENCRWQCFESDVPED